MEAEKRKKQLEIENHSPSRIIEKLSKKFSEIGLKADLSFLDKMTREPRGNMIQQLLFEAEEAEKELKAGRRIRWCEGKKMILNDNDCQSPAYGKGCHNWKKEKCGKEQD